MILIGLGSNLPGAAGPPRAMLEAAIAVLAREGIRPVARSRWYRTDPVPASDQPWFVNGVVRVDTRFGPRALLAMLQRTEAAFGRKRSVRNSPRILDLDLLDFEGRITAQPDLILPHPRLHERAFVLRPLAEVAPDWRHPISGRTAAALLGALPPGQKAEPLR